MKDMDHQYELMDIININFYPELSEEKINIKKYKKVALSDLESLAQLLLPYLQS